MFLGQVGGDQFGQFEHYLQPKPAGMPQFSQTELDKIAGIAGKLRQVADQAQGGQI